MTSYPTYIPPHLITVGDFHRLKVGRRGENTDDWMLIAENVKMYIRPRKPSGNARPQSDFDDPVADESQWYWARLQKPIPELRLTHVLTRKKIGSRVIMSDDPESERLSITQSDIVGPVHHLLLSEAVRSQ